MQIEELVRLEEKVTEVGITGLNADFLRQLKRKGFADARLAKLAGVREAEIRKLRDQYDLHPVYKRVDTCAAEFATDTAYMYSTYEDECEANPSVDRDKIMVLGGGPNRIGRGIEFDYCCVHASLALREDGYETIMVNCNPETVSTDYDTSDRLYFEPVTLEDVLEIVRIEKPKGVIVQYGGQTPLKLARALEAAGVPVIGTSPDAIDRAEDRERFQHAVDRLKLKQPANATVTAIEQAVEKRKRSATRWWCVLLTCWAAGRWKLSMTKPICVATSRQRSASLTMRRCCWTASLMTRLKWTWTLSATAKWC